ncbi:MAG: hypothetical protein ACRYFZ_09580 [Janthinobacterium lividum]
MATPEQLAAERLAAIAQLEQQLAGHVDAAQRDLYERMLAQLEAALADPAVLIPVLAAYQAEVLTPLATYYAQQLLHLPALNTTYFQKLDVAGYQRLRAPLTDFLAKRLGVDATGAPTAGGYLAAVQGDTTVTQQVLKFAYSAQASGVGLTAYKQQLQQLVTGGDKAAEGVIHELYRNSGDEFSQADRALQVVAGKELGLKAALYQGGLIDSSRPFCVARNGKVFVDFEIAKFGTSADAYGGYSNKKQGLFAGKTDPYDPLINCGGHNCRHHWHFVPNVTALRMRPDLGEDGNGALFIK